MGNVTNNIAEYQGFIEAMKHGVLIPTASGPPAQICFRIDSLIVAKQVNCEWRCSQSHLQPLLAICLIDLRMLRSRLHSVHVEHVYREYSAEADGAANEAIDLYNAECHINGIVISANWS